MAMNLGDERLRAVNTSRPALVHTSSQHSIAASDDYYYSLSDRSSPDYSDEATTVIRHQSPEESRRLNTPRPLHRDIESSQHIHTSFEERLPTQPLRAFPLSRTNTERTTVRAAADPTETFQRRTQRSPLSGDETPRPSSMAVAAGPATPMPTTTPTYVSRLDPRHDSAKISSLGQSELGSEHSRAVSPLSSIGVAVASENPNVHVDTRYSTEVRYSTDNQYSVRSNEDPPAPAPKDNRHETREWRNPIAKPVPTPGADPTPELHFALDQLTRDEEIRGSGRYSTDGYSTHGESRPGTRDAQQPGTDPRPSRGSESRPLVTSETQRAMNIPRKSIPVSATPEAFAALTVQPQTPDPGARTRTNRQSTQSWLSVADDQDAYFRKDARFNSVPGPIQPKKMIWLILLCIFIIAALVVSSVHTALSFGLNQYDGTGTSLYFVYRYLPQLFAAVTILWLHIVQGTIQRILPFILIRSTTRRSRGDILRTTPLFLTNFLLPNLAPFQDGEIGLGLCNIVFWLTLFTLPLASTLYTPTYFSQNGSGYWRWTAVQAICWLLIPIYFLLAIALIFVLIRFNVRPTGLRWHPMSIADILVLLRRLNSTIARQGAGAEDGRFDYRPASLGLWRSSSSPNTLTHGIGVPRDIEAGLGQDQPPPYGAPLRASQGSEHIQHQSTFESWRSGAASRHAWLSWYMRPSPVALWIAIALVLMTAFLVASWVNRAVQVGFEPQLFAGPEARINFSSANFLYSFLPALLGLLLYLFWLPFDAYFRALQPYVEMQAGGGATASQSVLLEYPALVPIFVSFIAASNKHFRVAWISFVPLIAMTIAVLAGGVFQAQYIIGSDDVIHEIASLPGYIALCVFVVVYALSFPLLWPTNKRRLPADVRYVASLGDFVVGGHMLNESVWRGPQTKSDLVGRLLSTGLTGEKAAGNELFRFGNYVDLGGHERVGIYR